MGLYAITCDLTENQRGYLYCSSSSYASARDGSGTKTERSDTAYMVAGQTESSGTYICNQAFMQFDTSVVPDDEEITSVRLTWFPTLTATGNELLEARFVDWGGTIETSDFIAGASLGDAPLLATFDPTSANDYGQPMWGTFVPTEDFASYINVTGNTRIHVSSREQRLGNAPTGSMSHQLDLSPSSRAPTLIVVTGWDPEVYGGQGGWNTSNGEEMTVKGGIAGDLFFSQFTSNADKDTSVSCDDPSWTGLGEDKGLHSRVFYKVAEEEDVNTPVHIGGGYYCENVTWFVANIDVSDPIQAYGDLMTVNDVGDFTIAAPSVVQTLAPGFLLMVVASSSYADAHADYAITNDDPGLVQFFSYSAGSYDSMSGAYGTREVTGATGGGSVTLNQDEESGLVHIIILNPENVLYPVSSTAQVALALSPSVSGGDAVLHWSAYIIINNNDETTDDRDVIITVHFVRSDSVTPDEMRFTEDLSSWPDWEPYAETKAFRLSLQDGTEPDLKVVYADFRQT